MFEQFPITIDIPNDRRDPIDTVVKITLDGPAGDISAVSLPEVPMKIADGRGVLASNVYLESADLGPDKAFDNDPKTRWATDAGVKQAWIQVDYDIPAKVSSVRISEEFDRVKSFELQARNGGTWRTFYKGTAIGKDFSATFAPLTVQAIRLNIIESTDGPTFWEIAFK